MRQEFCALQIFFVFGTDIDKNVVRLHGNSLVSASMRGLRVCCYRTRDCGQ